MNSYMPAWQIIHNLYETFQLQDTVRIAQVFVHVNICWRFVFVVKRMVLLSATFMSIVCHATYVQALIHIRVMFYTEHFTSLSCGVA